MTLLLATRADGRTGRVVSQRLAQETAGKTLFLFSLRTNLAPMFCNHLLMFYSYPVAELNQLQCFLIPLLVISAVPFLFGYVEALSTAAIQQGLPGIILQENTEKSETLHDVEQFCMPHSVGGKARGSPGLAGQAAPMCFLQRWGGHGRAGPRNSGLTGSIQMSTSSQGCVGFSFTAI